MAVDSTHDIANDNVSLIYHISSGLVFLTIRMVPNFINESNFSTIMQFALEIKVIHELTSLCTLCNSNQEIAF